MDAGGSTTAGVLADLILVAHVGVVGFVVVGQLLFMLGGWVGWRWVRRFGLRLAHLLLMLFIVAQTWLGLWCPLTVWEKQLRAAAGERSYAGGFIEHWLTRLIYFELPPWVFAVAYSVFFVLVVATWWWVPPRRGGRSEPARAARTITKSEPHSP